MGTASHRSLGWVGAVWGVAGVIGLLSRAIVGLTPLGFGPLLAGELTPIQRAAWALWAAFMLYTEGWRGFHLAFAPRVVARAAALIDNPTVLTVLLAPAYCMALFHAPRRRIIVSWCLLVGIVALVVMVRQLPEGWRCVVDGGVVLGLSAGTASVLFHAARALAGTAPPKPAELPEG